MDCPFSLLINYNEDRDDPEIDEDEHLMVPEKKNLLKPVEDFKVEQFVKPLSTFDAEIEAKAEEAKRI